MKTLLLVALLAATKFDPNLPVVGTTFPQLPAGKGRSQVEAACYRCHSADILVQQRLTEKQWTATVEKMVRWGAVVPEKEKGVMIAYLAKHFGPANTKWQPRRTRP